MAYMGYLVFDPGDDVTAQGQGVITKSWADLLAEVETDLAAQDTRTEPHGTRTTSNPRHRDLSFRRYVMRAWSQT